MVDKLDLVIKNSYLHKFNALRPLFALLAQESPADILEYFGTRELVRDMRDVLVRQYAWAVPSTAAIRLITRFSPIVEVGAGLGYWAYLLGLAGADVVAYDAQGPVSPFKVNGDEEPPYAEVLKGEATDAVAAHPERTLFFCWPSADGQWADEALRLTRARHVIFVGWHNDDVTGSMDFHNRLAREWELIEELAIPQWTEMKDRLFVYRRR